MNIIKNLKIYVTIFLFMLLNFKSLNALENKILFKIDNEIITTIDIYEQIRFFKVFNPEVNSLNEKDLFEISKNTIVREKIKKIEAMNYVNELKVEDRFMLMFIKNNYSKIGLNSIENFENYLKDNNLNIKTAKEKIAIDLIWNDIIFQKFNSKVNIDKEKIKKEILNNSEKQIQKEVSLSEIVFDVIQKSDFQKKYDQILLDIEQTGFKNAALIHSISD